MRSRYLLTGRFLRARQTLSPLLVFTMSCSGAPAPSETRSSPNAELHVMKTRDEWPCYDNRKNGTPIAALKKGRGLDEKDIEVLAALYRQLVVGDLLGEDYQGIRIRKLVIRLGTQNEHDIIPSDEFLQQVSVDSLVAVAAAEFREYPALRAPRVRLAGSGHSSR